MSDVDTKDHRAPRALRRGKSILWRWQAWAALFLLAVMFVQLLGAATRLSATVDEGFHITSGYEYLRTGRLRLFDEHTPLVKALFAWPLFFVPDLAPPEQASGWAEGDLIRVAQDTVLAYRPIDRVIVPPRMIMALLTLLLGATVYRWAAHLFGPTAGVLALALFAFDPNVLAHGSLATTDMGAAAFGFWAVYAFARYLHAHERARSSRPGRWALAGLLLGLAQGAKLTALLLVPLLGLLALVDAWRRADRDRWRALLASLVRYAGLVAVAVLVLWALYGFEWRTSPAVAGGTLPLPVASHFERWVRLQDNLAYGRESFLLGQNSMHGWPAYFPIAFALKTPVPTLAFALLALAALGLGRKRGLTTELELALFPLVYTASSLTSTLNIGYRHLLPVLPFLFVSAGRLAAGKRRRTLHFAWLGLCLLLLAWLFVGTLLIYPHYLAYFNTLAGGADEGYRFLADSNTDWGQTLKALAAYQKRHGLGSVRLSQFTFLDPAAYGVDYGPIAPMTGAPPVLPHRFNPEPGWYAISATTLDGVPLALPATFDWFRRRDPQAKIGHAMFLYQVPERDERPDWVAQCTLPVSPLTPVAIAEGFGSATLRRVYFDCEASWIFPGGGATPGWFVRVTAGSDGLDWPRGGERLEWWPGWIRPTLAEALKLSYVQSSPGALPPFAIWEWQGATVASLQALAGGEAVFEGTLAFLGYQAPSVLRRGATAEVLTFWRVLARPARPLSLMLHLGDGSGPPLAVGDGLGVPIDQWIPGDVIVQRHRLAVPGDAPPGGYQVRTGVYWLEDMIRLTVDAGDHLLIATVTVVK